MNDSLALTPQSVLLKTAVIDSFICVLIVGLQAITVRGLIAIKQRSQALSQISLAYCFIGFIIVFYDMCFNLLLVWFSTVPVESRTSALFEDMQLFNFSTAITALVLYEKFTVILFHVLAASNRACAVFAPTYYSVIFTNRRMTNYIGGIFLLFIPVYMIFCFRIFDCTIYFCPYDGTFHYKTNSCHQVHVISEMFFTGVLLSLSTTVDLAVTIFLIKRHKAFSKRGFMSVKGVGFAMQTLILAVVNCVFSVYLHTLGLRTYSERWLDLVPKHSSLLIALTYILCIALVNNSVRHEVFSILHRAMYGK